MYIGEWASWLGSVLQKSTCQKFNMPDFNFGEEMSLKDVSTDYTKIKMSDTPRPIGPYYAYNKRYLEIRGGMFENFRGIITWVSLALFMIPVFSLLGRVLNSF